MSYDVFWNEDMCEVPLDIHDIMEQVLSVLPSGRIWFGELKVCYGNNTW